MLLRDREGCATEQKENIGARLSRAGSAETSSAGAPPKSLEMLIPQPGNGDRPGRAPAPAKKGLSSMDGGRPSPAKRPHPARCKNCLAANARTPASRSDGAASADSACWIAGNFSWAIGQLAALSVVRSSRQRAAASARPGASNMRTACIGSAAAVEMAGVTGSASASTLGDRHAGMSFPRQDLQIAVAGAQLVWGARQC